MRRSPLGKRMKQASQVSYLNRFFRGALVGQEGRQPVRKNRRFRLLIEPLEDRTLLDGGLLQLLSPANPSVSLSDAVGGLAPKASQDGRYIVYQSSAPNLVPGQVETSLVSNIFLYDKQTGTTTLVSHAAALPTTTGDAPSTAPRISGDGRYVTYTSEASDLVAGQTGPPGVKNVFLYDRTTGSNTLVSHHVDARGMGIPTMGANADSDVTNTDGFGFNNNTGQFLVFISRATDLVPGQFVGQHANVYLFDRVAGTTTLVSHAPSVGTAFIVAGGNGDAETASISQNGNLISYDDFATNLVSNQGGTGDNIFLYNRLNSTNILVSGVFGSPSRGAGSSSQSHISADGSTIVYLSSASNIIEGQGPTNGFTNLYRYLVASGRTVLVSGVNGSANMPSQANTDVFDVSSDGTSVVFRSDAANLAPGQSGPTGNIFYYQASGASQTTKLVSHVNGSSTVAAGGSQFTVDNLDLTMSLDGRFVAYQSTAGNLLPGQTGPAGVFNVFLYDFTQNQSTLVSGSRGSATTGGAGDSRGPRLSADGSTVVYISNARDLLAGLAKNNPGPDVFAFSRPGSSVLVSRSAFAPSGVSGVDSVSADGRFVVFTSNATNAVPGQADNNFDQDLFLLDRTTGTVTLVSHIPGSLTTTGNAGSPNTVFLPGTPGVPAVISADGNFIAFVSSATNLVANQPTQPLGAFRNVFLYDRSTGTITLVSRTTFNPATNSFLFSDHPAISADGRYVAYVSQATDLVPGQTSPPNALFKSNVFLYDRVTGTTTLVSGSNATTTGNDNSTNPSISDDGRFIAYESLATNLVPGVTVAPESNVYLFDRSSGKNILVSHAFGLTGSGNAPATHAVLSADGSYLAFVSFATNLVSGQSGVAGVSNVFRYKVADGSINLVSGVSASATQTASANSDSPVLSVDGSYVAFRSDAADLVAGQTGPRGSNIFLFHQLPNGDRTLTLVSHAPGAPTTMAAGNSTTPSIDGDGSLVAYLSTASNLVPGQSAGGINNVFGWAQQLNTNILLSGQDGSLTTISPFPASQPIVSRDPIVIFNVSGTLIGNTQGTINAIANKLLDFSLAPAPFMAAPDGSLPAGMQVGTLKTVSGFLSQLVLPTYTLPVLPTYPDNNLFTVGQVQVSNGWAALLTKSAVNLASRSMPAFNIQVQDAIAQFSITGIFTLTVAPAPTTVAVSSLPPNNTSLYGQPVTFTAAVSSQGGPVSSGTVTFTEGNTLLAASIPLDGSGHASFPIATLTAGLHVITATYNGTPIFSPSSGTVTQTVNKVGTSTVVTSLANPSLIGQGVTFTATVSPNAGSLPATGIVQFIIDGSNASGPVSVSNAGTATFTTFSLSVGTHVVSANFSGDNFASSSGTLAGGQTVNKIGTSTALASTANPSVFGQSISFTAVVTPSAGSMKATGTVQFVIDGTNFSSPVSLSSGTATSTAVTNLSAASHIIQALYSGDATFLPSGYTLTQTVAKAATSTAVSSSANPSQSGQSVTFTAAVGVLSPGAGTPTGTVQFVIDGSNAGSPVGLNSAGTATFTASSLTAGSHTVAATYSGDANFSSSSGTLAGGQMVSAAANVITWINAAGGDWDTPSNWNVGRVPTASDDVVINIPGITVTHALAQADAVHSLTTQDFVNLSAGSLALGGPCVINAAFTIGGGILYLNGATLDGSATLVNQGTLVVQGNSAIDIPLTAAANSVLNLVGTNSGITLTVANGFTNDGLIELTGTAPAALGRLALTSGTLTNNGTIAVAASGTFTLSGVLSNLSGGTLSGGTYDIAGTFQLPGAAITTNAATIVLDGPGAQIVDQSMNNALASFANNAANGSFTVQDGQLFATAANLLFTNNGTLTIGAGSRFDVTGSLSNFSGTTLTGGTYLIAGSFQFTGANIVTNAATIALDGTSAQIVDQANNNALSNFAANAAAGSLSLYHGSSLTVADFSNAGYLGIDYESAFTANGAYSQSGAASVLLYGTLNLSGGGSGDGMITNNGNLVIGAGTSFTVPGSYSQTGTVYVLAGATLNLIGPFTNFAGATLTGGTYVIDGTLLFTNAAIQSNAATIVLAGAGAQILDEANDDALASFADNTASGSFTIQNGRNFSTSPAVTFSNEGVLTVGAGSTFTVPGIFQNANLVTIAAGGVVTVTGTFANFDSNSMTLTGGAYAISGTLQVYADIRTNAATIVLDGSGQLVNLATNDSALANFATNAGEGSFTLQDGATFTTAGDFSNAGSLSVGAGSTFTIPGAGAFTNEGVLTVGLGGTFAVTGTFANFDNTSMTLTDGTYYLSGTLQVYADIRTNAATIVLDGSGQLVNLATNNSALANFATNAAGGSFTLQDGATFTTAGDFSNAGSLSVGAGSTFTAAGAFSNAGNLSVAGSVLIQGDFSNSGSVGLLGGSSFMTSGGYTQTGGSTTLSSATLTASGLVDLQGGVLSGSGTISASVRNAAARIDVGGSGAAGLLTISGDYTQTVNGVLDIEIGGTTAGTDFDQLAIGGMASLGGILNVSLINGFQPVSGEMFQILSFGSRSGDFAADNGLDLGGGLLLSPQYAASSLTLVASGGGAVPPGGRASSRRNRQGPAWDPVACSALQAGSWSSAALGQAGASAGNPASPRACLDAFFKLYADAASNSGQGGLTRLC